MRIGIREHKRSPGPDRYRHEPHPAGIETGIAVSAWSGAQTAVEAICPGVVGTLESAPSPGFGRNDRAAVPADVDKAPQLAVVVDRDHDRHGAGGRGEVAARSLQLADVPCVLPGAAEDPLQLDLEDCRIRVPGPWDGRATRELGQRHQTPSRENS